MKIEPGPLGAEGGDIAVGIADEGGRGSTGQPREPYSIGGKEMSESAGDGAIGGLKIVSQFLGGECGGGIKQALGRPGGVIEMSA